MPRPCSITGCDGNAKYGVGFKAYAIGRARVKRNSITGNFSIFVCESHKNNMTPDELFSKEGWSKVQSVMVNQGKALLDRSSVSLTFRNVESHL